MSGPILASRDESRRLEALSIAHSPLVSAPAPPKVPTGYGARLALVRSSARVIRAALRPRAQLLVLRAASSARPFCFC